MPFVIDAKGLSYNDLNERIRNTIKKGSKHVLVKNVRGQRYLGTGIHDSEAVIEIEGIPGEDLGFALDGAKVIVHGHGQNSIGNTMDSGKIVVHGMAGDALAYGMRGGKVFIRDDVGYRVGIHMKSYKDKSPVIIVGGTTGDFLGEYMAGGTLIVLNRNNMYNGVAGKDVGTLATGIHGGEIFIFGGDIEEFQLGIGASLVDVSGEDLQKITPLIEEFCREFALDLLPIIKRKVIKIVPKGSRPFSGFYYPAYPINTGLKPVKSEKKSPCELACPSGIPTGRFLRLVSKGETKKAVELLDDYTPFRNSCCGHICPHLCMDKCTRGYLDFPINSLQLARKYKTNYLPVKMGSYDESVGVIGGGPTGLTAAYFLARLGYKVTVYEAEYSLGGKLYQVISRKRLPIEELRHDISRIIGLGINVELNVKITKEKFLELINEHDSVIVAAGAQKPFLPPLEGIENALSGFEFLKRYNQGEKVSLGERLLVIGAGDAALDGIEAALEMRVSPQKIVVTDIKIPAGNKEEIKKLKERGVNFLYPVNVKKISPQHAEIEDQLGNISKFPVDKALVFTSEVPNLDFLPGDLLEQIDKRGFYIKNQEGFMFQSKNPKIYFAGDVSGLQLVTSNVASGRRCAYEVHCYLQHLPVEKEIDEKCSIVGLNPYKCAPLDDLSSIEEHERCLHCGVCVECDECVQSCPRGALKRNEGLFEVDMQKCGGCGTCAAACKGSVILMVPRG
ncbi:MAG: FAD-dependent oxidoreductase [Bacillota bacterium]